MKTDYKSMNEKFFGSARFFTDRGFRLFPCNDHTERRNGKIFTAKTPMCRFLEYATSDYDELFSDREDVFGVEKRWLAEGGEKTSSQPWWLSHTRALGLRTGMEIPGMPGKFLCVVDADKGVDEATGEAYDGDAFLRENFPEAREAFCSTTPSGGRHYWFCTDEPMTGEVRFAHGLDARGWHNYVLMPGSRCATKDGKMGEYAGNLDEFRIIQMPPRLLQAIKDAMPKNKARKEKERARAAKTETGRRFWTNMPVSTISTPTSERVIAKGLEEVSNATVGERHMTLFRVSLYFGTLVPRYISEDAAHDALRDAAWSTGLEDDEIERVIPRCFEYAKENFGRSTFHDDYEITGKRPGMGFLGNRYKDVSYEPDEEEIEDEDDSAPAQSSGMNM